MDTVVSSKWMRFIFWVSYPFKLISCLHCLIHRVLSRNQVCFEGAETLDHAYSADVWTIRKTEPSLEMFTKNGACVYSEHRHRRGPTFSKEVVHTATAMGNQFV